MITPQMLAQLNCALSQVVQSNREVAVALRANLPRTWDLPMLRQRYPALSEAQLSALLVERLGWQPGPGKRPVLSLSEVLALDSEVERRLGAQRLPPSQRRRVA